MPDIKILNHPGFESQTMSYDFMKVGSISFNLPHIGDPLREEKSTVTITSSIKGEDWFKSEDNDEPLFGVHLKEAKEVIKGIIGK